MQKRLWRGRAEAAPGRRELGAAVALGVLRVDLSRAELLDDRAVLAFDLDHAGGARRRQAPRAASTRAWLPRWTESQSRPRVGPAIEGEVASGTEPAPARRTATTKRFMRGRSPGPNRKKGGRQQVTFPAWARSTASTPSVRGSSHSKRALHVAWTGDGHGGGHRRRHATPERHASLAGARPSCRSRRRLAECIERTRGPAGSAR